MLILFCIHDVLPSNWGNLLGNKALLLLLSLLLLFTIGFRQNKFTSLEKFLDAYALFLDLTIAFDCVTHEILFEKLKFYNFHDDAVTLVKSYLLEPKQYVYYNQNKSDDLF